jgi:hypothetical protein
MTNHRHVRHDRLDAPVNGRSIDYGSARIAGAPDADPLMVNARQALEEAHPVAEVFDLA